MRRNFSSLPFIALLTLSITLSACSSNVQSSQPIAAPQSAVRLGVFLTENRRLYMVNEQVGWAIGGKQNQTIISGFEFSTLLHTTDGGKTWQQINYAVDGIGDVYILDGRTAWGLAGNAQITSLYRTVDGGKTWQKFPAPVGYIPSSTTFIDASH